MDVGVGAFAVEIIGLQKRPIIGLHDVSYGVATISRLLKIIGLVCRI